MTFSTGGKRGQQKKTITITSNDPVNKISKVFVSAYIEVEFDFEVAGFNFGKVRVDEPVVRSVYVMVKDPSTTQITELESSSPFLTARQLGVESLEQGGSRIEIEMTLQPGFPPGKILETLKARSNLDSKKEITLRLSGTVEGDINVFPEILRFDSNEDQPDGTPQLKKVQVTNLSRDRDLNILSVGDPDGRINLEVKTLQGGQRYEIDASLKEESLGEQNFYRGAIHIVTDNPEQDSIAIDYSIYKRPKQ